MNDIYYIKAYTLDWNNTESNSLHLAYSYDRQQWYALNGGNAVLFANSNKMMFHPAIHRNSDNTFIVAAQIEENSSEYLVYDSVNLIEYTNERVIKKEQLHIAFTDTTMINKIQLDALKQKWGAPEPVKLISAKNPELTTTIGHKPILPSTVKTYYTNNITDRACVEWESIEPEKYLTEGSFNVTGKVYETPYSTPLIMHRADPFIYKHTDGYYYFTASYTDMQHNLDGKYQYDRILVRRAKTINGLSDKLAQYTQKTVYQKAAINNGTTSPHIWAPEIHYIDNKWYIYYTQSISDTDRWAIRPHVLECSDEDPLVGEWVNKGRVQKTNANDMAFESFSLDHTSFEHKGERYLLWAQNDPNSNIYIAKMSNPWTIVTDAVCITRPQYNWETHGFKVNEGPSILKRNGRIFMVYSASGTDSLYCLGMLTADEEANLLDPASWVKTPYPVFQSSDISKQYGPGHNSFTVSEDGEDDILVYHARCEQRYLVDPDYQPLYDAGRNTCVRKIYWNPDGTPNFSIPTPIEAIEDNIIVTATIQVINNSQCSSKHSQRS